MNNEYMDSFERIENPEGMWSEEALDELEGIVKDDAPAEDPAAYKAAIEAILFTTGRAVSIAELSKGAFCSKRTAKKAVTALLREYEEREGGILIRELNGVYQMCTNPGCYESLIRLVQAPKKPVLTDVVMETLAIIAYQSPTTKVVIEKIRGVSSDHAVNRLIEYGLVEECGRLDAPGRPALFRVTEEFYRRFGVRGKEDMPVLSADVQALIEEETETEVRESIKVET